MKSVVVLQPVLGRVRLGSATLATIAISPAAAAASATPVTVRVEGASHTLLPATKVTAAAVSVDPDGKPADACKGVTAAAALQDATHGDWTAGPYSHGLGYPVIGIRGESHPFTSAYYWALWIDGKPASTGICGAKLHNGDSILPSRSTEEQRVEVPRWPAPGPALHGALQGEVAGIAVHREGDRAIEHQGRTRAGARGHGERRCGTRGHRFQRPGHAHPAARGHLHRARHRPRCGARRAQRPRELSMRARRSAARFRGAAPATLAALAATALLAGCGLGAGTTPTGVKLTVTTNFGSHVLASSAAPKLSGSVTVMAADAKRACHHALRRRLRAVDRRPGLSDLGGRRVDWFYFVNGVQAPMGAAATNVHDGDRVWWDRHDWSQTDNVPAVVGSYPDPFVRAGDSKRLPVTVYCVPPSLAACKTVTSRLLGIGVTPGLGALGTDEPQTVRVLVGTFRDLRTDAAASSLAGGPGLSGVYARFDPSGTTLALLDPAGRVVRTLRGGAGLVAATSLPTEAPTWVITGTDTAGVTAAARALDASALRNHFALALTASGPQPVPVVGGS